jgi:hypothetical protein
LVKSFIGNIHFFLKRVFSIGKVKTLSALNLDGNPLVHPPFEIIKQGVKTIQHYLRDDQFDSDDEEQMKSTSDDDKQRRRTTRPHSSIDLRKSKYFDRYKKKVIESPR